ncbi:hypothetical protein AC1031_000906 [Aphanomyces cochlioides]|nr:hypothetical protein AC1031_000906 [Aphanomyces cochlioides]
MSERYSRRLAGLGVEYSGLEDSKATTPHDQATALQAQTEVYTADSADLPNDAEETSAGSPPSPDRKRPSDESPTISPPTERTPPKRPLLPQETPAIAYPDPGDLVRFEPTPSPAHAPSLIMTTPIVELEGSPASNPIAPTDEPRPLALRLLHSQAQQATVIQQELQTRQVQLLIENSQLDREHAALIEHTRLLEEARQNDFRTIALQLQYRYEQDTSALRMELETKYQEVCRVLQRDRIASNLQIQDAMATISDLNNQLLVAREQLALQSSSERTAAQEDQIRLQEVQTLNVALMRSQNENENLERRLQLMTEQANLSRNDLDRARQSWTQDRETLEAESLRTSEELSACYTLLV